MALERKEKRTLYQMLGLFHGPRMVFEFLNIEFDFVHYKAIPK